jgi:hypothetical protein
MKPAMKARTKKPKERRLSTAASPLRLAIRPNPLPLWGINLRGILGKDRWRRYRASIIGRRLQCETCGKTVEDSSKLQAHEEWHCEKTSKKLARATLKKITFDCFLCHACEHFPHTRLSVEKGTFRPQVLDEVVAHFCRVNGTTRETFEAHCSSAEREALEL